MMGLVLYTFGPFWQALIIILLTNTPLISTLRVSGDSWTVAFQIGCLVESFHNFSGHIIFGRFFFQKTTESSITGGNSRKRWDIVFGLAALSTHKETTAPIIEKPVVIVRKYSHIFVPFKDYQRAKGPNSRVLTRSQDLGLVRFPLTYTYGFDTAVLRHSWNST